VDVIRIEHAVREILEAVGEDPDREGLRGTPRRVAEMLQEILAATQHDPSDHLEVFFSEPHEEMVILKDIPLFSMCEHHVLPFFGHAHIAYIPKRGRVTGLSKLARVVEGFAQRLQMQERLTAQIADSLMEKLQPWGVLVVIEAEHMCMTMRGVKKPGTQTVTSAVRGVFQSSDATRAEALALIYNARGV